MRVRERKRENSRYAAARIILFAKSARKGEPLMMVSERWMGRMRRRCGSIDFSKSFRQSRFGEREINAKRTNLEVSGFWETYCRFSPRLAQVD